jgi:hypothetical protein
MSGNVNLPRHSNIIENISINFLKGERKMEYQENRRKICIGDGCNNKARVKGLCMSCYIHKKNRINEKQ